MTSSADVAFWEERYRAGRMPWRSVTTPPELAALVAAGGARAFVPGCGTGEEVGTLADAGWDVLAIDTCPAAVELAQAAVGPRAHLVRLDDALALDAPPFDLVVERAFLCALPPDLRPAWSAMQQRLVRPGGLLAGYWFVGPWRDGGPPYAIDEERLAALLPGFALREDAASQAQQPVYRGAERWRVYERVAPAA